MDKQQILNEISKTKEHLANMEKMLKECEIKRWKPKEDEQYYFVNTFCVIDVEDFLNDSYINRMRYKAYNCFQTEKQAKAEAEKILIRRQLEDIAKRLNRGEKINWEDKSQNKHYICSDITVDKLIHGAVISCKAQGTIYCLDPNFLNVAIQEIGEERLIKYLKSE